MTIKLVKLCLMVIILMACAGIRGGQGPTPDFDLSLQVVLGEDQGQGLGTLFEARDADGTLLFGGGFQDSYSTHIRDNNRLLSFFSTHGNGEFRLEAIGKPFPETNATQLVVDSGIIPLKYWIFSDNLYDLQYVGNKKIELKKSELLLDGRVVYSPPEPRLKFFYSNGILVLCVNNRLLIGAWNASGSVNIESFREFVVTGFPYAIGAYNDEIIITTNLGGVYSYKNGGVSVIREGDGVSFQVYSIINVNDQLILGQYPSGSLYVYDGRGLRKFTPRIPCHENAMDSERETQSLTLFGGQLYAGLWPWGEIWKYDFDSREWSFVTRAFKYPEMSADLVAPYAVEMRNSGDDYNYWGQRITSLVPYQNYLYVATSNKNGSYYNPINHSFIPEKSLAEYGQIYRMSGPTQITAQIIWKHRTTFRFVMVSGTIQMYQDGILLAKINCPAPKKEYALSIGNGIYGTFKGSVLKD